MSCTSASITRIAKESAAANQELNALKMRIENQSENNKAQFFNDINTSLKNLKITDAREISYNSNIIIEFINESSSDKIKSVVTSTLEVAKLGTNPSITFPSMSPEAINSYVAFVESVINQAKPPLNVSTGTGNSYAMKRLSPGFLVFLYASTISIKNEGLFGSDTVVITAVYYRIMQSLEDAQRG